MPSVDGETSRLNELYAYDVLDTPPEQSFDRITRLAKQALQVPITAVSLIDRHRQWFKSRQGLEAQETPREVSFCTYAIGSDQPLVVADALEDVRFRNNPFVKGEPHIRFYAGIPLRTPNGFNLGTLCAIDSKPRAVTQQEMAALQDLARLVVDELELRRLATVDSLTGAMTLRAFLAAADKELARARRHHHATACIVLDLDHFKRINDTHGHAAGDHVLTGLVELCRAEIRDSDAIGRVGGEEFAILLPETDGATAGQMAERLRGLIRTRVFHHAGRDISATASFGVTDWIDRDGGIKATLARADAALYAAKESGRDRVVVLSAGDDAKSVTACVA